MPVEALGYIGIRSKNLEDWAAYATQFLGMQLVDRTSSMLSLRMDDRKQRIIVNADTDGGAAFFGWEVADAVGLGSLSARPPPAGGGGGGGGVGLPGGPTRRSRCRGGAREPRTCRRAPRQGPHRLHRSHRQPA